MLAGRYTIEEQIGAGGMGAVYSAMDGNTQQRVAIKIMLPSLVKNPRAQERFMDEARISQQLSHPNIVNVYDVQNEGDLYFLTMELLEGQDLRSYMENLKLTKQPYEIDDALETVSKICEALAYAHEFTIHRDIKPENIWLTHDGKVKVMDFGLARLQSASQRSSSGAVLGTAYYMAPEQIKGREDIDGRADQFAIGVMLYEMLSGDIPTGRLENLSSLNKLVNKKLSAAVDRLLSSKPEQRYADMKEVIGAITNTGGFVMPNLPIKGLGIAAAVVVAVLLIGGLAGSGGLDNVWQALKPIDKEQLARDKAEVAKLQGEIKNYQRRLENGRRQLDSDLRDAARNDDPQEKYLEHWQTVTDNYLFEGSFITELEGELSMGESLLRENSIEQAKATLTQVRDGYKGLWEQFSAAEDLKKAEDSAESASQRWSKRKKDYGLSNPSPVIQAEKIEALAKASQSEGDFNAAVAYWGESESHWDSAFKETSDEVAALDKKAKDKEVKYKNLQLEKARARKERLENNERQRVVISKDLFNVASKEISAFEKDKVEAMRLQYFLIPMGSRAQISFAHKCFIRSQVYSINDLDYHDIKIEHSSPYLLNIRCKKNGCIKNKVEAKSCDRPGMNVIDKESVTDELLVYSNDEKDKVMRIKSIFERFSFK